MIRFENDYAEGAHKRILVQLMKPMKSRHRDTVWMNIVKEPELILEKRVM